MKDSEASGSIKETKELRQRVAKLERVNRELTKSQSPDPRSDEIRIQWEKTFGTIKDMIMVLDNGFKIVRANPAVSHFTGKPLKEIIGKTCCQVIHGTEKPAKGCPLKKAQSSKSHEEAELYVPEKDIWIEATVDPKIDERGMVSGAIHIIRDNTERKRAEQTLRESEEHHRAIFTSAVDGIIYADRKANVVEVNPAFTEITGIPRQEVVGKSAFSLARRFAKPKDIPKLLKMVRRALKGKAMELYELEINNKTVEVSTPTVMKETVGITGVIRDISDRRRAEEALRENEKRFRDIFESSLIGLYQTTPDGRILMANPVLVRMLGYTSFEELAVRNLEKEGFELDYPRSQFKEQIEADGQIVGLESAWIRRDGTTLYVRESAKAIRDSYGNTLYYQGTVEDITEQKNIRQALQDSERKLRSIIEHSVEVFYVHSTKHELTYVSPQSEEIFGYKPEEMMVKWPTLTTDNPINEKGFDLTEKAIRTGQKQEPYLLEIKRKDGERRIVEIDESPVKNEKGKVVAISGALRDVTEFKKAEEAYRLLVDHSLQGLAIFQDGRIVFANEAMAQITGYTVDEMLVVSPKVIREFIHPEDREMVWGRHQQRLEGKRPPERYEFRGIRKDGSVRWMEVDANRVEYQGKPAIQAAYLDISERKKAEKQEQEHIRQLQYLSESATEFVKLTPDQDIYMFIAKKIKNFCDGSIVAVNTFDESSESLCVRALVGLGKYTKAVTQIMSVNPVGQYFPLNDDAREGLGQGKLLKVPNGIYDLSPGIPKVVCQAIEKLLGLGDVYAMGLNSEGRLYGSVTILTRNKKGLENHELIETFMNQAAVAIHRWQAVSALRESEEMFRSIFETSLVGVAICSTDKEWLYVNDQICKILGYSEQELRQMTWEQLTHPDDLEADVSQFNRLLAGEIESYDLEKRFIRKDGSFVYARIYISCKRNPYGAMEYNIGLLEDITERKLAERKLRNSEEQFRVTFAKAGIGVAIVNPDGQIVDSNVMLQDMLGYSKQELAGMMFTEFTHPDDVQKDWELFQELSTGKRDRYQIEKCYVQKDGQFLWGHLTASLVRDAGGEPRFSITMLEDITQHKKTMKALEQSEEKYRNLFENAGDVIATFDTKGNVTDVNKAVEEYGFQREQIIGKSLFDYIVEGHRARAIEDFGMLISGRPVSGEMDVITPKGVFTVNYSDNPIMRDKEVIGIQAILKDITERKKGERDLIESEEKYRSLFENSIEGIGISRGNQVISANKALLDLFGYSSLEEFTSMPLLDHVAPESRDMVRDIIQKGSGGRPIPSRFEHKVLRKDGTIRELEISRSRVIIDGEECTQSSFRDITERKRAEEALKESEHRFKMLFECAPDGIYLNDMIGTFVDGNKAAEELTGYKREELIGSNFAEAGLLSSEEIPKALANLQKNINGESTGPDEFTLIRKDGSHVSVEIRTFPVRIGNQILALGIARDITERKKAEDKLHDYQDKLKAMASEWLVAEEHERQRIAMGLHDEICQKLVFTKLALESSLKPIPDSKALAQLKIISESIGETIDGVNALTFKLSNPVLRELGFAKALQKHLVEEVQQKYGIAFELEADEHLSIGQEEVKNSLFRISKELLMNIVKHAQARNVKVTVYKRQNQIRVVIRDDGVGFDVAGDRSQAYRTSKFGLFSIREQLENLGGSLSIESVPGRGTTATVVVPFDNK